MYPVRSLSSLACGAFLGAVCLFNVPDTHAQKESSPPSIVDPAPKLPQGNAGGGTHGWAWETLTDSKFSWERGFHFTSRKGNLKFDLNGTVMADGGTTRESEELAKGFPDVEGNEFKFRMLTLSTLAFIYDVLEIRAEKKGI